MIDGEGDIRFVSTIQPRISAAGRSIRGVRPSFHASSYDLAMRASISLTLLGCAAAALAFAGPSAAQQTDTTHSPAVEVAPRNARPHRDRNLLTPEEFASRHDPDAYQLIRALRPGWLRGARGVSSVQTSSSVVVYRDGMRVGGPRALLDIPAESIREIRYFDAIDATQRWGTDHAAGAIVVTTR